MRGGGLPEHVTTRCPVSGPDAAPAPHVNTLLRFYQETCAPVKSDRRRPCQHGAPARREVAQAQGPAGDGAARLDSVTCPLQPAAC